MDSQVEDPKNISLTLPDPRWKHGAKGAQELLAISRAALERCWCQYWKTVMKEELKCKHSP